MPDHLVVYEISVDANSPDDAAQLAWDMISAQVREPEHHEPPALVVDNDETYSTLHFEIRGGRPVLVGCDEDDLPPPIVHHKDDQ